jgi:hypothetical protein
VIAASEVGCVTMRQLADAPHGDGGSVSWKETQPVSAHPSAHSISCSGPLRAIRHQHESVWRVHTDAPSAERANRWIELDDSAHATASSQCVLPTALTAGALVRTRSCAPAVSRLTAQSDARQAARPVNADGRRQETNGESGPQWRRGEHLPIICARRLTSSRSGSVTARLSISNSNTCRVLATERCALR